MKRILVVEDNPANRKLFGEILRESGYDARLACTADEAIALALAEPFDLVVMDIQLPGTDGLTATAMLRTSSRTQGLPVLAVTAHAMQGDEERMRAAGCDGYLTKPVSYRDLLAEIGRLLNEGPASR